MAIVHPEEIGQRFLEQYAVWKEQRENYNGQTFTDDQLIAMLNTIKDDPDSMIMFYYHAMDYIISTTLQNNNNNYEELSEILSQWSQVLASFMIPVISVATKSPEEIALIRKQYAKEIDQLNGHDPLTNIDFNLPKLDLDDDPEVH